MNFTNNGKRRKETIVYGKRRGSNERNFVNKQQHNYSGHCFNGTIGINKSNKMTTYWTAPLVRLIVILIIKILIKKLNKNGK